FGGAAPAAAEPSWQGYSAAQWTGGPPAGNPFGPTLVAPTSSAASARGGAGAGAPPPAAAPAGAPGRGAAAPPSAAPPRPAPPPRPAAAARGAPRAGGPPPGFGPPPAPRGSLKVVTTRLRAGYLRKNGVPYSADAVVTEYYDRLTLFGNDYLQVVTVVTDPTY